jgi:hypothetical protein
MTIPVESGWLQTASGKKFRPLEPDPALIDPYDIGLALSRLCRYGGMTSAYFSVAQHSVLVSQNVPPEHALAGLLHDAAEAYIGDMVRPLKQWLRQHGQHWHDEAETRLMEAVCARFGVAWPLPPCVDEADNLLLVTESRDLMSPLHPEWHYCEANGYAALPRAISPVGPDLSFALWSMAWCNITGDSIDVFKRTEREKTGWTYPILRRAA